MKLANHWLAGAVLFGFVGVTGCGHFHHHSVKIDQVPEAARVVIAGHTAGAEICRIKEKKQDDGTSVYKVKYKKNGKKGKLKVSSTGQVLEQEEPVTLDELPAPVRATVEQETAGQKIDELEKETEDGKTFYEVEFHKDGKEHEIYINPDGSVMKRKTD